MAVVMLGLGLLVVVMAVIMLGLGLLVVVMAVVMLGLGLLVVVMAFVASFVPVVVFFKRATFTKTQFHEIMGINQLYRFGLGTNGLHGFFEKRLELLTDPEHHIGRFQHLRLRRLQGIGVGRAGTLDNESRHANAVHHRCHKRVNRLDGRYDLDLCLGRKRGSGKKSGSKDEGLGATHERTPVVCVEDRFVTLSRYKIA